MQQADTLLRELHRDGQAAHAKEVASKAEAVESVRAELRQDYETAKQQESVLKRDSAAMLQELAEIEQAVAQYGAHRPDISRYVPTIKAPWLGGVHAETGIATDSVFRQMQAGCQAFDGLRFEHLAYKDGRQVDVNKRQVVIVSTRRLLRCWDGCLSASRSALGELRRYLQDWTDAQPSQGHDVTATALVDDRESQPDMPVKVESAFRV